MLAVGGLAGVSGYRGARWSRGGYNAAFVGNAGRFPEGAAADVHVAFERMVAWGRLGSARRVAEPVMEALWEPLPKR